MVDVRTASRRVFRAAGAACVRAAQPNARLLAREYAHLHALAEDYLAARFGSLLDAHECDQAATIALLHFLPPLFVWSGTAARHPQLLLDALNDAALDVHMGAQGPPEEAGQGRGCAGDREFAWSVFGHDDWAYLCALNQVRREGARLEFLVVTTHMVLFERLGRAPGGSEIAASLARHAVTPSDVERLLRRFARRLWAQG